MAPCPLARVHMKDSFKDENLLNKSIKEIWRGKSFAEFRRMQKIGCKGCKARKVCQRCIPQSIQWFKDPLKPPPYCIKNADSLRLKDSKNLHLALDDKLKQAERKSYLDGYNDGN